MRIRSRSTQPPGIPTASMADIAFLLIIFFMVTFNAEVDKARVTLPQTNLRFEVPRKSAVISIVQGGRIRVSTGEENSVSVSGPEDVLSFAASVVAVDPHKAFILKADTDVEYQYVDGVMDALKQAKAEVIYLLSDQEGIQDGATGG